MQQNSNRRLYIVHSDRVSNPVLRRPLSDRFPSKGDANPAENEPEGDEVSERDTVTQSRRVVKSTLDEDFKHDLQVF